MAIYIQQANLTILEIPKTGTSWVHAALAHAGIHAVQLDPIIDSCPRHSPGWCYRIPDGCRTTVILRHPYTWLESYWRFHRHVNIRAWKQERLYLHRTMFGDVMPEFDAFASQASRNIAAYHDLFLHNAEVMLRQETLINDLAGVLESADVDCEKIAIFRDLPRQNVTDATTGVPRPSWSTGLKEEVDRNAGSFIRRFW